MERVFQTTAAPLTAMRKVYTISSLNPSS